MCTTPSPSPPYSVYNTEAIVYYVGLPSRQKLVCHTGDTLWEEPCGLWGYTVTKELKPVFDHKIIIVWKTVADEVVQHLDSLKVRWTSIDSVRLANIEEETIGPVMLWIGVFPSSISSEDAYTAVLGGLAILKQFDLSDVNVEFRESVYIRSVGQRLLKHVNNEDPTAELRGPLTPTLGLQIAAVSTPLSEGTGGLYIAEGGDSNKIFLLTARHVVFPSNEGSNDDYVLASDNTPFHEVQLIGTKTFENYLESAKKRVFIHGREVEYYER
jgi:hypothetical protein